MKRAGPIIPVGETSAETRAAVLALALQVNKDLDLLYYWLRDTGFTALSKAPFIVIRDQALGFK